MASSNHVRSETMASGPRSRYANLPAIQRRRLLVRALLRTVSSIVVLVVLYYLLPLDRRALGGTAAGLVLGLAGIVVVIAWQIRAILTSAYPAVRAVEALAIIVPLFLLTFASAYFVMEQQSAGSFNQRLSRTDSLYFAVTVFATVGFGDIAAKSEAARITVTVQMIADLIAIGVGLRVIVGATRRAEEHLRPDAGSTPPH